MLEWQKNIELRRDAMMRAVSQLSAYAQEVSALSLLDQEDIRRREHVTGLLHWVMSSWSTRLAPTELEEMLRGAANAGVPERALAWTWAWLLVA